MVRAKQTLDHFLEWFCFALFVTLVVTVTWQVFTRLILNAPSGWSEELAKYVFIWLGLFGSALVFGEGGHIAIDFVVRKMPTKPQRVVAVFVQLIIIVFSVLVLINGGWKISALAWNQNLTGLPLNVGWLYMALPISGVLTVLYSIYHTVAIFQKREGVFEDEQTKDVL